MLRPIVALAAREAPSARRRTATDRSTALGKTPANRTFLRHPSPIAAALMSRMRIGVGESPRVELECLRMLATLRLDPARTRLISGFLDTYLRLTAREQRLFASELDSVPDREKGSVMEIVTSLVSA